MRELAYTSTDDTASSRVATDHARHLVFSILRVGGSSTPSSEVDPAESHYKRALMTRELGLNRTEVGECRTTGLLSGLDGQDSLWKTLPTRFEPRMNRVPVDPVEFR